MPRVRSQSRRPRNANFNVPDGPAAQRVFALLVTSAGLLVLFAGYCLATRTLHATGGNLASHSPVELPSQLSSHDQTERMAKQFLPQHRWAAKADYQGQTVDRTLFYYCNNYKQVEKNVIRIEPFAMILRRKDSKPGDPPYTITSAVAYVTFEREFNIMSGPPGPIVSAKMQGDVFMDGPHNLHVKGQNFYFQRGDAMKVYSDDHVEFFVDRHSGNAKGVEIELIKDDKAKPDEPLAVAGVNSVKLLKNVNMKLVSDSPQQMMGAASAKVATGTQPVKIHSEGSFLYIPATHVATFESNVTIRRETMPAHYDSASHKSVEAKVDSLSADKSVEIVFDAINPKAAHPAGQPSAPPSKSPPPQSAAKQAEKSATAQDHSSDALGGNLQFKSLHAHGDAVTLVSQANALTSVMRDFYYDKTIRKATLSAAPDRVQVRQNGNLLRAPEIFLTHDEQGDTVTEVLCRGAGEMWHYDEKSKQIDLTAEWLKEMHKYPDPKSSLDCIDLKEAIIQQPKESSGIAAGHIRLWVVPQARDHRAARPNMPSAAARPQNGLQLHHMEARQKVAMVSPQLELDSELLSVWFEPAPAPPKKTENQQPAGKSAPAAGTKPPAESVPDATAGEPYHLSANEIHVRVLQSPDGRQPQVAEVLSKTNVVLTQKHPGTPEELRVDGSELRIQNRSPTDQDMVVLGQPAHVNDRGAHIEGSRIRFNRAQNTADVDGAGQLRLPTKQSKEPQLDEPQMPLDVAWKDNMHFDGKAAHFEGNVRTTMDDGKSKSNILCRDMDVTLKKPFSFTQERKKDEQSEVETIFCNGGVELDSQATLDGQVMELRRGAFPQLRFHRPSGRGQATGPGWLCVWRHSKNGQSGLSQPIAKAQANSPPKSRKVTAWEYTIIHFATRMEGDFQQMMSQSSQPKHPAKVQQTAASSSILGSTGGAWDTTFYGDVQVLYGPVNQKMDTVSRDELPDRAGWIRSDRLDVKQHPETETQASHITLLATGNCQLEGKEFRGESNTISYDGSKGFYVLQGGSGRQAEICRQKKVGGDWGITKAVMLTFNPDTGQLKIDQATMIDGSQ